MKSTIRNILQGFLLGSVIIMILFLATIARVEACTTSYKWVCDDKGNCQWISVCE